MPAGYYTAESPAKKKRNSSKWAGASLGQTPTGPATRRKSSKIGGVASPVSEAPALSDAIRGFMRKRKGGTLSGLRSGITPPMRELLNMTKRKGKYPSPKKKKVASPKSPKVRAHTLHERGKAARRGSLSY